MITADGGGSNGSRVRLFKIELQKLADETGLTLQVCHYPPGTSKWNKIEHRLFCHITENWRGTPLTSRLGGGRTHRLHHDQDRPDGTVRTRHADLPKGDQSQRGGNGQPQHQRRRLPPGVELYHFPQAALTR